MKRPPLWIWALPACTALGLLLGVWLRGSAAPVPAPEAVAASSSDSGRTPSVPPAVAVALHAPVRTDSPAVSADTTDWGWDGGGYGPLSASAAADTLPAAPEGPPYAVPEARESNPPVDSPAEVPALAPARAAVAGPAQELGRAEALGRPLVGAVRAGGRLSFYAAWDAPSARASLVGDWAAPGQCAGTVRLDYEQPAPGLGAVRGVGTFEDRPAWSVAVLVPRQHCAAASPRWREARSPRRDEAEMFADLAGGARPTAVVTEGETAWIAWPGRAVRAGIRAGRAVAEWSAAPPEGASIRLLGVWDGEGVWVSTGTGGRILQVWRVPAR